MARITLTVQDDLLRRAQAATGKNVTETVHRGLERLAADRACDEIRKLRGKVEFPLGWRALRAQG